MKTFFLFAFLVSNLTPLLATNQKVILSKDQIKSLVKITGTENPNDLQKMIVLAQTKEGFFYFQTHEDMKVLAFLNHYSHIPLYRLPYNKQYAMCKFEIDDKECVLHEINNKYPDFYATERFEKEIQRRQAMIKIKQTYYELLKGSEHSLGLAFKAINKSNE